MNIFQVSYKNLFRRKIRTAFTLFGIALSTWVFVTLLGFSSGYKNSLDKNIENMGFQIVLAAKGCPYEAATLMLKGGTGLRYMPQDVAESVLTRPEVAGGTPMLMHAEFDPNKGEAGGTTIFLGIDSASYPSMKAYLSFFQGSWFEPDAAREVVLGYEAAELEQRDVGDLMLLPGTEGEYTVAGILNRTGTQDDGMIYLPLKAAQTAFKKEGELTMLGLRLHPGTDQNAFEEELYSLPDVQVVSMAQVKSTIMDLVSTAKITVILVASIAFIIAMFGVLNTVLMMVFERYQEIGILKSMGAMPKDIFTMILTETTLLCGIGGVLGIACSFLFSGLAENIVRSFLPFAPEGSLIAVDGSIAFLTFIAIFLVGILGGMYPAWQASRIRPLDSMRSE
jgi:putative ABC transport system permease protein